MNVETATDEHPSSTSPPNAPAGPGQREVAGLSLSEGDDAALKHLDQAGRWIARGGPALGLIAGTRTLVVELQTGGAGRGSWIVGLLDGADLRTVDIYDASGARTLLKLEGIEQRPESSSEFDVVVDLDRPAAPAQLGRLVWAPH